MPAYIAAAMRAQRERNERMVVTGARLRVHLVWTPCLLLLPLSSQRTRLTSVPHPTQNQQTPTKCDAGEFQSQTATEITVGRRRVLAGDRQRRQCRPAPADITGPGSAITAGIAEPMGVHTPAVQPSCRVRGRDHQFDRRSSCDRHRQGIDRQQLQRLQHLVVRLRTE